MPRTGDTSGPISIIHAFSRRNAGDGLLVDLTLELLGEAGIGPDRCRVFALDPESFPDLAHVERAPGEPAARPSLKLLRAAVEAAKATVGLGDLRRELHASRAIVAVGGGYLVGDDPVRQAGIMLNHFSQLAAAADAPCPTVYLPQSIGPLNTPTAALIKAKLQKIDRVWVRDDQTALELPFECVGRVPDLAVMKLGRSFANLALPPLEGPIVLVGRDLPRAPTLQTDLRALAAALPDHVWAVQAETEGKRDDREFYRRSGFELSGRMADLMQGPSGPVVSIRLHGAIAGLLAGRPAIHLAYERKGWGAFEDLGIADYVHDVRNFDPMKVAAQALELQQDPDAYWEAVRKATTRLSADWDRIVDDLLARL
ncbi:MAG: polysaccharide pyruvyl transferase family protein [Pseudomonadota bacterium]